MSTRSAESRDGGVGLIRFRRLLEQFRQSLFYLPALFVLGSVVAATVLVGIDERIDRGLLPDFFATTVDNARSILATVAGGTIGAASVVFSLTLVAVQLASSQFSPRVLRGFLGDRFQQLVMGVVVGTFTYSLLVLRVVRAPLDPAAAGAPFLPQVSVLVAVIMAVASLLAVLASIDHTAKRLRVGSVLDRIASETMTLIDKRYPEPEQGTDEPTPDDDQDTTDDEESGTTEEKPPRQVEIPPDALAVQMPASGWVTQVSFQAIAEAVPTSTIVHMNTSIGAYTLPTVPIAHIWPIDEDAANGVTRGIRDAIEVSKTRTMQQDVGFGIVQLVDIALRALSPGVNDPNTAIEALGRIGTVVGLLLQRPMNPRRLETETCLVIRDQEPSHLDYVRAAFDPILRYARQEPEVLVSMADILGRLLASHPTLGREPQEAIHQALETMRSDLSLMEVDRDRDRVCAALDRAQPRHAEAG